EAGAMADVLVAGIGELAVALLGADRMPLAKRERSVIATAGDGDAARVLLAGVDPIWEAMVGAEPVELTGRLVVPARPGCAAVDGDDRALIGRGDPVVGMLRVGPQGV